MYQEGYFMAKSLVSSLWDTIVFAVTSFGVRRYRAPFFDQDDTLVAHRGLTGRANRQVVFPQSQVSIATGGGNVRLGRVLFGLDEAGKMRADV